MIICSKCGGKSFHRKGTVNGIQKYRCVSLLEDGTVCGCRKQPVNISPEEESEFLSVLEENVRLAKRAQKFQDKNRIENKSFRESARMENALGEYIQELRDVVKENRMVLDPSVYSNRISHSKAVGIVHLSDLHFNELVDIVGNKYDFKVASQRLRLFADKIITAFTARNISKVFIIFTGDLLNSDRRLDEMLSMATNRAMATFVAVKILAQFIIHLAMRFDINIISITGNESRIKDEYTQLDSMATDNFDFMIYEMLKLYLEEGNPPIKFISGNTFEYVLSINNKNILIVHGHRLGKMTHNDISKAVTKWAKKGIIINSIMCGHLHETQITDTLLRSGSLVGNNAYADAGLNLHSMASQNFYIVDEFGNLDATKVELQSVTDDSPMYEIDEELDAYNAKSIDKLKDTKSVLKVVI